MNGGRLNDPIIRDDQNKLGGKKQKMAQLVGRFLLLLLFFYSNHFIKYINSLFTPFHGSFHLTFNCISFVKKLIEFTR